MRYGASHNQRAQHDRYAPGFGQVSSVRCSRRKCRASLRSGDSFYPKGVIVSDDETEAINLVCDKFHGEWNITISPSLDSG